MTKEVFRDIPFANNLLSWFTTFVLEKVEWIWALEQIHNLIAVALAHRWP